MIMRLVKTAALMWLAKKVKDKALGNSPAPQNRTPTRQVSRR